MPACSAGAPGGFKVREGFHSCHLDEVSHACQTDKGKQGQGEDDGEGHLGRLLFFSGLASVLMAAPQRGLHAISDGVGEVFVVGPLRDGRRRNADCLCDRRSGAAEEFEGFGLGHVDYLSALSRQTASTLSVKPAQMMKMPTLQERTKQALDAGYTNAQLATAAGVTSGAVSQWLTTTKKLKAESVLGLARLTGWRAEWWAEGIGPRESTRGGSPSELVTAGYTSETPSHFAVIRANLKEPEAELIVRLIVASDCPGISVEGSEEWITSRVRGRRGGDIPAQMPRQERPKALESTKGKARKGIK
jgi:hypothetical protein